MWKKVESNTKPNEVEITNDGIYVRRNITEATKKDEMSETEVTYFEYEENLMTENEYSMYQDLLNTQEALQEVILMNMEAE